MVTLEVRKLTKDFGGLRALNAIDFDVYEGEIAGLVGPNGSGKSTLFNVIIGLIPPTEGQVTYKGELVTGLRPDQIAQRGIVAMFQGNSLFPNLTAKENVMASMHMRSKSDVLSSFFSNKGHRRKKDKLEHKAMELLDFVGLKECSHVPAKNLPHGEQRELQIAMILATEPGLLLLDEPTAGMNPEETLRIMNLIQTIRQMVSAIIVVEHNMRVIMGICQRVTVIDFGVKIAEGTPSEVSSNKEVISVYLGKQRHA